MSSQEHVSLCSLGLLAGQKENPEEDCDIYCAEQMQNSKWSVDSVTVNL